MRKQKNILFLVTGDVIVLALVTAAGFASHGELRTAGLRLLSTFIPLCVAWALVAPWVGVFQPAFTSNLRQLWRPPLAVFLAAPLAGWLRGFWLGTSVVPVFVLVLASTAGLGILAWRTIWMLLARQQASHG